jgi:hypothetical protein
MKNEQRVLPTEALYDGLVGFGLMIVIERAAFTVEH